MLMTHHARNFLSLETFCLQLDRQDLKSEHQCKMCQEMTARYLLFYTFFGTTFFNYHDRSNVSIDSDLYF